MLLRNVGNHLQCCAVYQPRRPQSKLLTPKTTDLSKGNSVFCSGLATFLSKFLIHDVLILKLISKFYRVKGDFYKYSYNF